MLSKTHISISIENIENFVASIEPVTVYPTIEIINGKTCAVYKSQMNNLCKI